MEESPPYRVRKRKCKACGCVGRHAEDCSISAAAAVLGAAGGRAGRGKSKSRGSRVLYAELGSAGGRAGRGESKSRGSSALYAELVNKRWAKRRKAAKTAKRAGG